MLEVNIDDVLDKNKNLLEENERLKKLIHLLNPEKKSSNDSPFAQLIIYNHLSSQKYRDEIESFIISRALEMGNFKVTNKPFRLPNGSIDTLKDILNEDKYTNNSPFTIIGCAKYYDLYLIDSIGSGIYTYKSGYDQWIIPLHNTLFFVPLGDYITEEIDIKAPKNPGPRCFNCEGPHILSASLQKLDYKIIAKNKSEFLSKSMSQSLNNRYHIEVDPRFVSFKPGQLSANLNKALGLKSNELPPYIYMMRILGYPPGHFIDAKKSFSNISLLKDTAEKVPQNANHHSIADATEYYDIEKIVSYEGFNTPLSRNIKDDYQRYGSVPMHGHHSKTKWLKTLYSRNSDPERTNDANQPRQPDPNNLENNNFEARSRPNFSKNLNYSSQADEDRPETPSKKLKQDESSENAAPCPPLDAKVNGDDGLGTDQLDPPTSAPPNLNSVTCVKGTPVLQAAKRKHIISICDESEDIEFYQTVPSLDSFAQDVQPFSYDKDWDKASVASLDGTNAADKRGIFERIKRAFDSLKQRRR